MHKTRNKHGPDTATGIRMGWPRGPAYITGEPPPWMEIRYGPPSHVPRPSSLVPQMERWRSGTGKRDGPHGFARGPDKVWPPGILKSEKRRRWRPRDFITLRRTGESPPGIVNKQIINYIDSTVRSRLPARGRLKQGFLKDIYCLNGNTMALVEVKNARKDAMAQRHAIKIDNDIRWLSGAETNRMNEKSFRPEYFKKMTRRLGEVMTRGDDIRWLSGAETNRIKRMNVECRYPRRDAETQRNAKENVAFRERMVSTTLNHRLVQMSNYREKSLDFGRKLTQSCRPSSLLRPSSLFQEERQRSIGAIVPRPFCDPRPSSNNNQSYKHLKTLNN